MSKDVQISGTEIDTDLRAQKVTGVGGGGAITVGRYYDAGNNPLTVKNVVGSAASAGVHTAIAAVATKEIWVLAYKLQTELGLQRVQFLDTSAAPATLEMPFTLDAREIFDIKAAVGGFEFKSDASLGVQVRLDSTPTVNWSLMYVEV